jgi:hypothetical protein
MFFIIIRLAGNCRDFYKQIMSHPMKKVLLFSMFLLMSAPFTVTCYAGDALSQLQDTARDSEAATREPTDEGAREGASLGFDTNSATPVDLSGKENGVVDPADLK